MQIKIKKLGPKAIIPKYAKNGDACVDLIATTVTNNNRYVEYGTSLTIEIPSGYFGLIRPRSSVSNMDMVFQTSGIVDSGYRGEITVRLKKSHTQGIRESYYKIGDRVAQLMILPYPTIEFVEVEELSQTERGTGGYGSTNN